MLGLARVYAELRTTEGDYRTPTEIVGDLEIIDKALTVALQKLIPLRLEHQEGWDLSVFPYNWTVVQELHCALAVMRPSSHDPIDVPPTFPTKLISDLCLLRDAARKAIEMTKPGRGNSAGRNPSSLRRAHLAKDFVFQYRSQFGRMPTMSQMVIKLLRRMLDVAGEQDADAYDLLRRAIAKDESGRKLLPSARS